MKKIIFFLIMFFVGLSSVHAGLTDNAKAYWALDDEAPFNDSSTNSSSLTNSGSTNTSGKINEARNFDGSSAYMTPPSGVFDFVGTNSISFWFKSDSATNPAAVEYMLNDNRGGGGDWSLNYIYFLTDGTIRFRAGGGTTPTGSTDFYDGTWHHVVFTVDGANYNAYVDGVSESTGTVGGFGAQDTVQFARRGDGALHFDGSMDEISVYNKVLNSSEIAELYNNGTGFNPYTPIPGAAVTFNKPTNGAYLDNTSFLLNVSFDQLTNASYVLNGGSKTTLCTDCNESANTTLIGVEGSNTLTVFTNTSDILNNESITFTIDLTNPSLTVNLPSEINSYQIDFSQYINVSDTNLDTCTVEIIGESSTTCTDTGYTFTTNGNKTINVTATDLAGNTNTSLNNLMLVNPTIYFSFNDSGTPITSFTFGGRADTAGSVGYNIYNDGLSLGSNTLLFEKLGFISQNFTFTLNTSTNQNFSFDVSPAFINVRIFDRITESLITDNISLQLIGAVGDTTSTVTGLATMQAINGIAGDYQIIASTANYETESVYFTYSNQENITVDVYMLNSTDLSLGFITIEVKDQLSFFIESAIVDLLEWKPSLSSYVSVAQCQTATNGKCNLNIELNNKLYKFQATKETASKTTNAQIISETGQSLTITLEDLVLTAVDDLNNVLANMTETVVGNVSTTRLQWTDTEGVVAQACITTFRDNGFSLTQLNQNCTSASSGILFTSNNINNTFPIIIKGTIQYVGTSYLINEFYHNSIDSIVESFERYNLDIYIPVVFLFIALGAGLFFGNIYLAAILTIILEWMAVFLAPSVISTSMAVVITMFSLLMMWGVSRK